MQAAARWLAQLHSSEVALPRRVDLAQEVKTTREWAELIASIYPWAGAQARWVADHWVAQAAASRTGRAVPLHRDFHPGHVLVSDLFVIDLDEARCGDPTFDVAHFCATSSCSWRACRPRLTGALSAASLVTPSFAEYAAATGWQDGGSVAVRRLHLAEDRQAVGHRRPAPAGARPRNERLDGVAVRWGGASRV